MLFSKGTLLCGLLKEYVNAVNEPNAVPCLDNAWQNTVDLLRAKTMEELVKTYKTSMAVCNVIIYLSPFVKTLKFVEIFCFLGKDPGCQCS